MRGRTSDNGAGVADNGAGVAGHRSRRSFVAAACPLFAAILWYLLGLASVSYACSRPGRLRAGPPGGGTGLQRKLGGAAAWRAYAAPGLLELATLGYYTGWPNQQGQQ